MELRTGGLELLLALCSAKTLWAQVPSPVLFCSIFYHFTMGHRFVEHRIYADLTCQFSSLWITVVITTKPNKTPILIFLARYLKLNPSNVCMWFICYLNTPTIHMPIQSVNGYYIPYTSILSIFV